MHKISLYVIVYKCGKKNLLLSLQSFGVEMHKTITTIQHSFRGHN